MSHIIYLLICFILRLHFGFYEFIVLSIKDSSFSFFFDTG